MRFLRLYKTFIIQHIKKLMEYRIDFLTGAMSFFINQVTNIVFIGIIFSQIPNLDGYLFYEIIFIYGFSLVPKGIDHLLTDNLWKVAWFIVRKGDFDKYLTRPISPLVHCIIESIQFDALGELLTGIILIVIASVKLSIKFTFVNVVLMIIAMIFGAVIFTAIKIIGAAIAFWIKQSGSILQIFYGISDFARYPATIYNSVIRNVVTYIIPFAFTAYYPASYILRGNNPLFCIGGVIVAAMVLLGISLIVWHKGLNAYESAGS
ncbi:MAG: ABC-2 family transporter protein [Lachnospiraceae bacterium]|nr:ABC-2 family transporter protein [Lachnospiraceae bacterium]MDE6698240.1 ABC-2 family transporter protein [Lachnospiraceae bacterium]